MQIFKLNRSVQGIKVGTLAYRLNDIELSYQGTITVEVLDDSGPKLQMKTYHLPRSRLTLIAGYDPLVDLI